MASRHCSFAIKAQKSAAFNHCVETDACLKCKGGMSLIMSRIHE